MAEPFMEFDAVLRREHFADFSQAIKKRFGSSRSSTLQGISYLVVSMFATLGLVLLVDSVARPIDPKAWLGPGEVVMLALMVGMLATLLLGWLMSRTINATYLASAFREGGSYLGPRHFTLDEEGIEADGTHGHALTRWSAMLEMTEAASTYLLWTDPGAAVMVPKDAFQDEPTRAAFEQFARARMTPANS